MSVNALRLPKQLSLAPFLSNLVTTEKSKDTNYQPISTSVADITSTTTLPHHPSIPLTRLIRRGDFALIWLSIILQIHILPKNIILTRS